MISKRRYRYLVKYLICELHKREGIWDLTDRDLDMDSDFIPSIETNAIPCRRSLDITSSFCAKHQVDKSGVMFRCNAASCDCGVLKLLLKNDLIYNARFPDLFSRKSQIISNIKSGVKYLPM